jgi:hypothetical protein
MAMLIVGNKMWNVMLAANCNLAKTMGSRASMIRISVWVKGVAMSSAAFTYRGKSANPV